MSDSATRSRGEFSLSGGGPAFALMKALRLSSDTPGSAARTALVLAAFTWLPLLVLSLAQGVGTGSSVRLPFLNDVSTYARFLVAVPLFVLIGPTIDRVLGWALRGLVGPGIVPTARRADFDAALGELDRGRHAWLPELALVTASLLLIWLGRGQGIHMKVSSWAANGTPPHLTWAGIWLGAVSMPLFLLMAGRWGWRILLWARFLRRLSKLDLDLVPSHPDGLGGLGILATANASLGLVMMPLSVTLAANAVNRVQLDGEALGEMRVVLGAYVVIAILLTQGPLLVFSSAMRRAKLEGMLAFSLLAERYSRDFDRKWLPRLHADPAPMTNVREADEALLGSPDIQSLADMGGSFEQVRRMRPALLDLRMLGVVAGLAVLPMVPLVAMVVPLQDVLEKLARLLLH
jgi:hypothetical protein